MGDDAEYELARLAEERRMEEARGPRNAHELFEKVRAQIAHAKGDNNVRRSGWKIQSR